MNAHAKLSASGAHRWLNCPGSVKAEEGLPESTSPFAEEGTAAHALAEAALLKGKTVAQVATDHSQEMIDYIQSYVDYVLSFDGVKEFEQRVSYEDWVEEGFGTADVIVANGNNLTLIDLKYGKGVKVYAEENPQGMLYALGALSEREAFQDIKDITIVIHQPRLDHISSWTLTVKELLAFGKKVKKIAKLCLTDDAPRVPSEKTCLWCKAMAECPALKEKSELALMQDFNTMTTPNDPGNLTDEQLKVALDNKKLIITWLEAVEKHVFGKLEDGVAFNGYKLVEGRSNRKWADEEEVYPKLLEHFKDDAFISKLITPAQVEKALGKKAAKELFGDFITKPVGKPTLVPSSDKRDPIVLISADDFN